MGNRGAVVGGGEQRTGKAAGAACAAIGIVASAIGAGEEGAMRWGWIDGPLELGDATGTAAGGPQAAAAMMNAVATELRRDTCPAYRSVRRIQRSHGSRRRPGSALRGPLPRFKESAIMPNPNTGRFVWHELTTPDAAAATKFYTGLFGWTVEEMKGPWGVYLLFKQGEMPIGGAMQSPPGAPSGWLVYVGVEDVDASAKKIAELGGKIMVPPTTVPDMLRFACAMDPHKAAFGIMKGMGPGSDKPPHEGPPRPGTFCWDELHTKELDAAKKFYTGLFGWSGKGDAEYWHWQNAGKDIGGMTAHMGGPDVPPHWLAYIAVSDVDEVTKKVVTLGGKVLMPAMELPKVGRFSVVQDPTGGVFSPFRSANV
jgi:predicted enzyme related to lactoylglutathione lyase